jgi:7-cyano-7-deazaguanine synthase
MTRVNHSSTGDVLDPAADAVRPPAGGDDTGVAIVLLSGGIDSTTALAMARARGLRCHALTFRYGQRHDVERLAAARVAAALGAASHRTIDLDLRAVGGSALTDEIPVPKDRSESELGAGIPVTYVPARNTIFVAYAIGMAEVTGASEIVLGINVLDSSGYPDCRPEWLAAMQDVARLGTKAGVEQRPLTLWAPLIQMTKAEIIVAGVRLGVDYGITHSCYDPDPSGAACGGCDACQLRRKGFAEAGVPDPTTYMRA